MLGVSRRSTILVASLVSMVSGGVASAQSLLPFNGRVIATNGDAIPGLAGGEVFNGSGTFDSAILDDKCGVMFRARMINGSSTSTTDRAYFYATSRGDLQMVLRSGDPEPSGLIPGATLNSATSTGLSSSPRISGPGVMFFGATLNDGGVNVNTSNDTAIYTGFPGNFSLLVREGDPAPGTVGATYSSSFSSPSQQLTCLDPFGFAIFKSNLAGGDVTGSGNDEAWFFGVPGTVMMATREGDVAPGGEVVARVSPGFVGQMNSTLQMMYDVSFVVGTGTTPVTDFDDRALWVYTFGGAAAQVVREGDPTPIPGVTFSSPALNNWTVNTGASTFNIYSETLIRSDLGGAVNLGVDDSAVFIVSTSGHTLVARRTDPTPDVPGTTLDVFSNSSMQFNDERDIAFQCTIAGAGVTSTDDSCVFAGKVGDLHLVAREGDVAPGTGGSTFGSFSGQTMLMNGRGQLLMNNTLLGGGTPGSSIWSWDPVLGLQPVLLSGDMIEVQTGNFQQITSGSSVQFNNGDSRPLSFNDEGDFAMRLSLSGGNGAIAIGHVGSLSAAPKTISAASGGTQDLRLNAGGANAGLTYLVAGSLGTTPGFTVGGVHVPLNPDVYFNLTVSFANSPAFMATLGTLDGDGRGAGAINVPAGIPGIVGLTLNHAFMGFNALGALKFGSEARSLTFVP